ncbi:MAG: hypothetical protein AB1499_17920, partial [Nitrospirota bacterium]
MLPEIDKDMLEDELFQVLDTMEKVKKRLEIMGIKEPPGGNRPPEVPIDVAKITDDKWSELYSKLLGYYDYLSYQCALAEGFKKEADAKLKYIKAKLKTKKIEEPEVDPLHVQAVSIKQEAEQLFLMVEAAKAALTKKMDMVSRDFERRRAEWERF